MLALLFSLISASAIASPNPDVQWKDPPFQCMEEVYPAFNPNTPCPDLTRAEITSDKPFWGGFTGYCYAKEWLRREALRPDSSSTTKMAWVIARSPNDYEQKIEWIYELSYKYQIPPQIFYGVLKLETLISDIGMLRDFGNYSCGIGSLNLVQWCEWANEQPQALRDQMAWPSGVKCEDLAADQVRTMFELALPKPDTTNAATIADASWFSKISLATLQSKMPATPAAQIKAVWSFTNHCAQVKEGLDATAFMLKKTYDDAVPDELKKTETYIGAEQPSKKCKREYGSPYYPFHSGWLLAYAVHNIGEEAVDLYRNRQDKKAAMNPLELIKALYTAGKYDPKTGKVTYKNEDGDTETIDWYWTCLVSRNVYNVVNNSAPGLVSLATQNKCEAGAPKIR